MKTLTELLGTIEARLNAATPFSNSCPEKIFIFGKPDNHLVAETRTDHKNGTGQQNANYEFIYHSPDDIKALLEVVRVLEEALDKCKHDECIDPHFVFKCQCPKHKAREAAAKILSGE